MKKIENKIGGLVEVDWENELFDLQPKNVKISQNHDHLKNSLLKHGFAQPFFTWKEDDKFFCLDGHTRKQVLKELQSEGVHVPQKLQAVEIIAKDRKEAVEILIEVFNQKHNPFSDGALIEWLEIEEIPIQSLNLASVPVEITFDDEGFGGESSNSFGEKNKEIDIDLFADEMILKLKFSETNYELVKEKLSEVNENLSYALLKLLKIE